MKHSVLFFFLFILIHHRVCCQTLPNYDIVKRIPTTDIKNQGYSGTCWSFATLSFFETEVLRKKNISLDLSEMFIVRNIYPEKAKNYFRTQGNSYFTAGGQPQDVLTVMKNHGLVPEYAYKQKVDKLFGYNTAKLDTAALYLIKEYRKNQEESISLDWIPQFDALLDKQLGVPPKEFTYNNQTYTPQSFCKEVLSLDAKDYIQITSFSHHPYNEYFCLESRYNWSFGLYYNVELQRFMSIIEQAIMHGFSVVFNGDVSEEGFDYYKGTATLLRVNEDEVSHRQALFEKGYSTVDHVMHIVGIAKGKDGKKYYLTKNSWGSDNACGGYMYLSEDYIKYKTMSILVNKEVLAFE